MTRLLLDSVPDPPGFVEVDGDELRYLTRVRRHGVGDRVEVRDAGGRRFAARVDVLTRESARLEIEARLPSAPDSFPVTMLVAIPKAARFDDVVRKLNELGVTTLVPVIAERSNAKPGAGRHERWRRIAAESTRQCGRRQPLEVSATEGLNDALARCARTSHRLILDPGAGGRGLLGRLNDIESPEKIAIAVGPEGGFVPAELETAERFGFEKVGLGPSILRVETAAIAAAALACSFLNGFD
jgi:16S rRNA (uracil1498-N3)-methyltransferase